MSTVNIEFLTPHLLHSVEEARRFFKLWIKLLPNHLPEKIGTREPLECIFDTDNLDSVFQIWSWSMNFVGRDSSMKGSVLLGGFPQRFHTSVSMQIAAENLAQSELIFFFKELCRHLEVDFALLEVPSLNYLEFARATRTAGFVTLAKKEFSIRVSTSNLRQCIPDVYWAMVFGKPYVKLFGHEKLLSAPAHQVKEINPDLVYLQLSRDFHDTQSKWTEVDAVRQEMKAHLDSDAFFDPTNPDKPYRVPEFEICGDIPPNPPIPPGSGKLLQVLDVSRKQIHKQPRRGRRRQR